MNILKFRYRKFINDALGQSLVEAAIVFPILLLSIFGIIQLSLLHNAEAIVRYAAFCAARTGVLFGYATPKGRRLMDQAAAISCSAISGYGLNLSSIIQTKVSNVKEVKGGIEVEVTHYYKLMLPFARLFFYKKAKYFHFSSILPGYYVPIKAKCIINRNDKRD